MTEKLITISQLANLFNVSHHTLRHYEDKGLLEPKEISSNGYRKYGMSEAYQLSFILFLKELGLNLAEIKEMLHDDTKSDYTDVLLQKKSAVTEEITRLEQLSKLIDEQIVVNQKAKEVVYRIEQPIYLKVLKELPTEQAFDLSIVEEIDWDPDFLMRKLYYIIDDLTYLICIESDEPTAILVDSGNYQVTTIESGSEEEFDQHLEYLMMNQELPLTVIEDGGRFLSSGKRIAVKVLGEKID
ncbi:MerR family transcriptional regulator [Vagococcus coleopterorum]|uniref:MerR family transcriptional regulator n=1 Tax=Vagococcus coleopterorum TaxID=2714946 RepID=A0A6G8APL4_9ENTE|nr:MerR family transcriptional regulator [Vagococcus coleopterorum]QIL46863.1 MerR family transcriptional regulator [Vagococcus coleopterorum]